MKEPDLSLNYQILHLQNILNSGKLSEFENQHIKDAVDSLRELLILRLTNETESFNN
jgi:hypothetical protein